MNISYNRKESAPYSETTSSGLTTFPLDFDILNALELTLIFGFSVKTKPSPFLVTFEPSSFVAIAFWASFDPAETYSPDFSSTKAVYSTSPNIIPCETNFWNGSFVETTPMSYNTLCQNRAYNKCNTACSAPPTYKSTGIQYFSKDLSINAFSFVGSINRK